MNFKTLLIPAIVLGIIITGYKLIILFLGSGFFASLSTEPSFNNFEIGDKEFYQNEIHKTTGIYMPTKLLIRAKLDTIFYAGMEGEYDAECIFRGTEKDIKLFTSQLIQNKGFVFLNNYQAQQFNFQSKLKINSQKYKTWFYKMEDGKYDIYIGLSSNEMYYKAWYY